MANGRVLIELVNIEKGGNMMDAGRPRKFSSAEEMYKTGMDYISKCEAEKKHLTITGLAIALDTTRETLMDYESGKYDNENNRFSYTVKRLKIYCENYAEQRIFGNNPAGAIFALKNYGWKDKTEQEISGPNGGPIQVTALSDDELEKRLAELAGGK